MNATAAAPLAGLRVIDLTRLLPGPAVTMHLADFGAEVIKVEDTGDGDYLRGFPPQVATDAGASANPSFVALNRGKKSLCLNLKDGDARDALLHLVDRSDALIESFRPGVLARLGLGWDVLHARNPRLVLCSISGYGQHGPLAQAAGHDINYIALAGVLDHPNVSAAIILGLGCEVNQIEHYLGPGRSGSERLVGMTLQESGGTAATVSAARKQIGQFVERASAERREELPASLLCLGLNCGGSDSFSGITANPALGHCSDLLAEFGATSVLAETPEIVGAEHLLVARARSRGVGERLLQIIAQYKAYLSRFGGSFDDNPSPGNKEGGLTNILEKSLGAVAKAGTSPLNQVYDFAERIQGPGFVYMNTPGYDPVSLTGLAAGRREPDRIYNGTGQRHRFPHSPGFENRE